MDSELRITARNPGVGFKVASIWRLRRRMCKYTITKAVVDLVKEHFTYVVSDIMTVEVHLYI